MLNPQALTTEKVNMRFSFCEIAALAVFFLATLNFANNYYYFVWISLFILMVGQKLLIVPNFSFGCLMLLSFSLILFSGDSMNRITEIIKPFTFPIAYLIGITLMRANPEEKLAQKENRLKIFLAICAFAGLVHMLLNWVTNAGSSSRNTIDYWTGTVISATGQAAFACIAVACAFAFIFSNEKLILKLLSVGALALIFGYNLILSCRTIIVLMMLTAILSCIYFMFSKGNTKRFGIVVFIAIVIISFIVIYEYNLFDVRHSIESSNFYARIFESDKGDLSSDKRFVYKIEYLDHLLEYPLGGSHIHKEVGKYAHDLFLDTYDYAGVVAFLAVVLFTVKAIINVIKIVTSKYISFISKQLMLCTAFVLMFEFFIEPILIGIPWLFATFCFIDGAAWGLRQTEVEQCA